MKMTLTLRAQARVLVCALPALAAACGAVAAEAQGIFDPQPTATLTPPQSTPQDTFQSGRPKIQPDWRPPGAPIPDMSYSFSSERSVEVTPVQLFGDRVALDPDTGDFLSRYRVGPGDVISIRLFGEDELNRERIRITDVGSVPYPVLGEIRVLGLRPVEIERLIEDGLRGRYLRNPKVSVTIDEYRPYFVTGEVGRAGSYPYTPGMTVIKAITIAGGFKERASRSKIFVSPESNPAEKRKVELTTPLEPGDILTIEESFF